MRQVARTRRTVFASVFSIKICITALFIGLPKHHWATLFKLMRTCLCTEALEEAWRGNMLCDGNKAMEKEFKHFKWMRLIKKSELNCSDSRVPQCFDVWEGQKLFSAFLICVLQMQTHCRPEGITWYGTTNLRKGGAFSKSGAGLKDRQGTTKRQEKYPNPAY